MKRMLVVVAALALLAPFAVAQAEPIQQFSFQLTNVKPDGRFTLLFTTRTFDTTGGQPPVVMENYLRLPAGATLDKAFLNKRWYCNGRALLNALHAHPRATGRFADRVANLKPFIRQLAKSTKPRDRKALANALACQRARIGVGDAQIDARPLLDELIPVRLFMFFGKATQKGAIAGFWTIGVPDERAKVVSDNAIVRDTHVALPANFFNEPTPDGLYGYKLVLPAGNIGGLPISVAELNVKTTGLTILKGTCLKRDRRGHCTRRAPKTRFWFDQPPCPPSGRLTFLNFFGYDPPQADITKTIELACPRFTA